MNYVVKVEMTFRNHEQQNFILCAKFIMYAIDKSEIIPRRCTLLIKISTYLYL